jgi:predicted RND superfamily exporter protein
MSTTERAVQRALAFVVDHPKSVLAVFVVCAGLLGWQVRHFEIDASENTLLTPNDVNYIHTQVVNQRFSPEEFLLVAYRPKRWPVFSPQTFADLRELSERLGRIEGVKSARSILNVPLLRLARPGASLEFDPSDLTIDKRHFAIAQIKRALAGDPIYEDLLVNKDQTATAIQLVFRGDPGLEKLNRRITELRQKSLRAELGEQERATLERLRAQAEPLERRLRDTRTAEIEAIRSIVADYADHADIHLGGGQMLAYQMIQIIRNDLIVFGSAIAVMIAALLWALFRRIQWVFIPILCCAVSVLATMGLFGMLGFKVTVISANFIALQLILTLSLVVHLIVQYREYAGDHPHREQAELVRQTLFRKAGPIFYAGGTTSIGFGSLLFSGIEPVITFGWMMGIAMLVSIAVSLILFPSLMAMFTRERSPAGQPVARWLLNVCARVSLGHRATIGLAAGLVTAASVAGLFRLDVENSFINYFRESTDVHRALAFIDREFGGTTPLDLVYRIPAAPEKQDLVLSAETVLALQRMQKALEQHKAVGKVLSVVSFTQVAKEINHDKPLTEYELTAVYWLLDKSVRENLVGSFLSPEHAQVRISARIRDTTPGLDRGQLLAGIHADMAQLGVPREDYRLTNLFVLYQDLLQRLFRSQILTLGIVYAVLAVAFVGIFRSWKTALIALAPNMLATLAVLGLMGWLRIPLDFMTITIASIAMGIAVDDTIHYIHRYREELRDGRTDRAVTRSHGTVGYAMLYTSVIIVLGFSLLAFSDFVPSILFGLLTALAMSLALVFALTVLPALLGRFVRTTP